MDLSGLLGSFSLPNTQPATTGLLGQYYDPKEMQRQKRKMGLLNAGIALLSQQPRVGAPYSLGESLGTALRGGMEGAQSAQQDYMNNAQMAYQMNRQAKDDAWTNSERAYTLEKRQSEKADEEAQSKAFEDAIKGLPPEMQTAARANKKVFMDEYTQHMMEAGYPKPQDPKIVPKGSVVYENGKWISPPAAAAQQAQQIENPLSVTKDYQGGAGFKRYQEVAPTINSMVNSLNDTSAMADLDFVYGLAKILDPTSVVRESEAGMVIDSQGIAPSLLGQLNKIATGEQAMSDATRRNLVSVAMRRAEELRLQAEQERGFYSNMLTQNQYDPNTYLQSVQGLPQVPPASPMQTPLTPPPSGKVRRYNPQTGKLE